MSKHIDTAPVWEAYHAHCECPLCHLERASEANYVEYFLGGSVMEPAVRVKVNQEGFCAPHFRMLYGAGNRLGVALMAHTYLMETIEAVEKDDGARKSAFGLRAKKRDDMGDADRETCVLCEKLKTAMARYEETLLYMWAHEAAFRAEFSASKGLCVRHYRRLAERAGAELAPKDANAFLRELKRVTLENLERVERDLHWFTLKFDYRNQDKPWGESRDAVERALNKLRSNAVRPEKEDAP